MNAAVCCGAGQAVQTAALAKGLQVSQIQGQVIFQTLAKTAEANSQATRLAANQSMGKGLNVERVA